jgi:hypothetical protein
VLQAFSVQPNDCLLRLRSRLFRGNEFLPCAHHREFAAGKELTCFGLFIAERFGPDQKTGVVTFAFEYQMRGGQPVADAVRDARFEVACERDFCKSGFNSSGQLRTSLIFRMLSLFVPASGAIVSAAHGRLEAPRLAEYSEVGDSESVAMIRYSGGTGEVTIRSRWQEQGGRPVLVHTEPAA